MIRIFVSSSHISTLYMILYAQQTNLGKYKDVLLMDSPPKKATLKKLMMATEKIYKWHDMIDLSPTLPDEADFEVSKRKSLTRKLKINPLIKPVYEFLLKLYLKKEENKWKRNIQQKLGSKTEVVEINRLSQMAIDTTLFKLYPKASINYFEHGMGDYLFVQQKNPQKFYCVFANSFANYLNKQQKPYGYVKNIDTTAFSQMAQQVLTTDEKYEQLKNTLHIQGKLVLILMESVQMYLVPDSFYTDYLDLCITYIPNPNEYTFVLKPHPFQTKQSIEISKKYMQQRNLNLVLLQDVYATSYSAEVLYVLWREQTHYVFSVFSSALYYISILYPNPQTKFCFAYDFLKKYISNAPKQFADIYEGLEDIVKSVLTQNCIDISRK